MLDVIGLRRQFPALEARPGAIFLDGPGGTQTPRRVIDALVHYLTNCNANHAGFFATSRESDALIEEARRAAADLLNAPDPDEIVFGQNMTTLTWHLSRSLRRQLEPGDEVIVSQLDHDANVTPWVTAAADAGATCQHVPFRPDDCTLDMDAYRRLLSKRTRWVAVACASNAVGTINDVAEVCRRAHEVGARVFLDAVHYAPHGPIDVQAWDCDFLACSAYKFFGPHVGVLWGKREHLESMKPDKLRPVADVIPDRWMTGTQNHEGLAGLAAAVDYLADIGKDQESFHVEYKGMQGRCLHVHAGLSAIRAYEAHLAHRLLEALGERPRWKLWGIADPDRVRERCPTFAVTRSDASPDDLARRLAERDIFTWSGNMYAVSVTDSLGLEKSGGLLRLGLVHYNTEDEVDRLVQALDEI